MRLLIGTGLVLALCAPLAARAVHQVFVLASAQVVDSTSTYPTLRLAATGPIAYAVEPDSDGDATARVVVRLYGVAAGTPGVFGVMDPFTVSVAAVEDGVRLTVGARDLPPGAVLLVRTGAQSSEIEIVAVQQP